jgi:hypothetical protein
MADGRRMDGLSSIGIRAATTLVALTMLTGCTAGESKTSGLVVRDEARSTTATDQNVGVQVEPRVSAGAPEEERDMTMNIQIGERRFTATLVDNSSTQALKELLAEGPITVDMQDYGNMEKVGELGKKLPTNDEQITTEPGDLILYQGSAFVIYYAPNSYSLTRLGGIDDVSQAELVEALGSGDVSVTLSLNRE